MKVIAGPFVRLFVSRAETEKLLNSFINLFGGKIDFQFDHQPSDSTVYSISSEIGKFSVTSTDKENPDFITKTRAVYVVEDIDEVLASAKQKRIEIAQDKTPVSVGFQSRLKISENNYLEIVQWADEHIAKLKKSRIL